MLIRWFYLCLLILLPYQVFAEKPPPPTEINYQVIIKNIDDEAFREQFINIASIVQDKKTLLGQFYDFIGRGDDSVIKPPVSLFSLKHRAKQDIPTFKKLLRSLGYFDGEISLHIDESLEPIAIVFTIDTGVQYSIAEINNKIISENNLLTAPTEQAIKIGDFAITKTILATEKKLLEYAKIQGYGKAKLCPRKILVNHPKHQVFVNYCLQAGAKIYLSGVTFTGGEHIDPNLLRDIIEWQVGKLYNQRQLNYARLKLIETRLFVTARLELAEQADEQGLFPVVFHLTERLPRTISTGLSLTTDDELFKVNVDWEHRNLWGAAEALETKLEISAIKAEISATLRKPVFYHPKNTLSFGSGITAENTDAFESLTATLGVAIQRQIGGDTNQQLDPTMLVSVGLAYSLSHVTDKTDKGLSENFSLVSMPIRYSWDFSNDFFDPFKGGRIWLDAEPFIDIGNTDLKFYKQKLRYNHYFSVFDEPSLILAGHIAIGHIFNAERDDLPADLRYYAGGGGSIRGYSYQSVGPVDDENNPLGGRSLMELSGEIRWWVTPTIGLVAFVDAGNAYESQIPDWNEALQIGGGAGLRYKTPIGPLRMDLAIPINKRETDDSYQVYISIGHSF